MSETDMELKQDVAGARSRGQGVDAARAAVDRTLARAARDALRRDVWVPKVVTVNVHHGLITLTGQVEWNFQRESAGCAVQGLAGNIGVNNAIRVVTSATAAEARVERTNRS
ncbi:MAG: BON domain-containing protein [Byssovorax sp.]